MKSKIGNFYEVTARCRQRMDTGEEKTVTETHVVSAVNFSEAETNAIKYLTGEGLKDVEIKKINPAAYSTLYLSDEENDDSYYYKVKIAFEEENDNGKIKRTTTVFLLEANDTWEAMGSLRDVMKGTISDWSAINIQETKIMGVYISNN